MRRREKEDLKLLGYFAVGIFIVAILYCLLGCSTPIEPVLPSTVQTLERNILGDWVRYDRWRLEGNVFTNVREDLTFTDNQTFHSEFTGLDTINVVYRDGGHWFAWKDEEDTYITLTIEWIETNISGMTGHFGDSVDYTVSVEMYGHREILRLGKYLYDRAY